MTALDMLTGLGSSPAPITTANREIRGIEPVAHSQELQRIIDLPRRGGDIDIERIERIVRRPNGTWRLRPEQAQGLAEAYVNFHKFHCGAFLPIAVGKGKTLLLALIPTILNIGPTVILTNAGLVRQAVELMRQYAEHFFIRRDIRWLSYGVLSSPQQSTILDELAPKLICADECQALANGQAARTKRFERLFQKCPDIPVVMASGSVMRKSIKDCSHLMYRCLRDRTPLPRAWKETTEWAEAVDVSDRPRPPGALVELMTDEHAVEFFGTDNAARLARGRHYLRGAAMRAHDWDSEESALLQKLARDLIRRRIVDTVGVVASTENELAVKLTIEVVKGPEDAAIDEAISGVLDKWERPDGELLTYGLEIARVLHHLRQGGYYRWVWPKTITEEERRPWFESRAAYRKELREFLKSHNKPGLDSPILVENTLKRIAAGAPETHSVALDRTLRAMLPVYQSWVRVRDKMRIALGQNEPPTEWVWLSDFMIKEVVQEAKNENATIVWTDCGAVGRRIAQEAKLPWYGAGEEAQREILKERGERSIVASIKAHGTGRNLQWSHRSIVVGGPSNGGAWEQLLGRTHRPGQEEDVIVIVYRAFANELRSAMRDAEFIEQTTGNFQKLRTAQILGLERT